MYEINLKNTIFIIQSPIAAMTMAIIAQNRPIEVCIVEVYKNYTEKKADQIKAILQDIAIKKLFFLDVNFTPRYQENSILYMKKVNENLKIISDFNLAYFDGNLFCNGFDFVSEACSQILNFSPRKISGIRIIDHGPADSINRINTEKIELKTCSNIKGKQIIKRFLSPYQSSKKIIRKCLNFVLKKKYPHLNQLYNINLGYTMTKIMNDTYQIIDYRKFKIKSSICIDQSITEGENALLLVSMKEEFEGIEDIIKRVANVDFIKLTINMAEKHILTSEKVILKFHPHLCECISSEEMIFYKKQLMEFLNRKGYKVYFFADIVNDRLIGELPIELFIKELNIKKIVGMSTSVFWTVGSWEDIKIISDCTGVNVLAEKMLYLQSKIGGEFPIYHDLEVKA